MGVARIVVGGLTALLMAGCGSPDQVTPEVAGGDPEQAQPVAPAITGPDLRQAWQDLVRADTGRSVAAVSQAPDNDLAASLPTLEGQWSFEDRASSSVSSSTLPDVGPMTLSSVVDGRTGYAQPLFEGSAYAPDCWLRLPQPTQWQPSAVVPVLTARVHRPSDEAPGNVTMRLAHVLGAIGFQKLANTAAADLQRVRVDATVRLTDGVLEGWEVTEPAITASLDQMPGGPSSVEAKRAFLALSGARWEVSVAGLGDPVELSTPPADRVLGNDGESCAG